MSNNKQLTLAWINYADDNNGVLVKNQPFTFGGIDGCWVGGWLDFTVNNTDNTNTSFLRDGKLGAYVRRNTGVYKCPADIYTVVEGNSKLPGVRSDSMNGYCVGYGYGNTTVSGWGDSPNCLQYNKLSDITRPTPTDLWVFVDEHPDSINDGFIIIGADNPSYWVNDLPASYHNAACGFGFADGHAEIHRWREAQTCAPVTQHQHGGIRRPPTVSISSGRSLMPRHRSTHESENIKVLFSRFADGEDGTEACRLSTPGAVCLMARVLPGIACLS